jgi:hypothetical protein
MGASDEHNNGGLHSALPANKVPSAETQQQRRKQGNKTTCKEGTQKTKRKSSVLVRRIATMLKCAYSMRELKQLMAVVCAMH